MNSGLGVAVHFFSTYKGGHEGSQHSSYLTYLYDSTQQFPDAGASQHFRQNQV